MPAGVGRWLALNTALMLASLAWAWLGRRSYLRGRELLPAAFRLNGAGWGVGYCYVQLALERSAPAPTGAWLVAGIQRAAMVTTATSVLPMLVWWTSPLRFWWAGAPAQGRSAAVLLLLCLQACGHAAAGSQRCARSPVACAGWRCPCRRPRC